MSATPSAKRGSPPSRSTVVADPPPLSHLDGGWLAAQLVLRLDVGVEAEKTASLPPWRERWREWAESLPVTSRCAACGMEASGPLPVVRAWFAEHAPACPVAPRVVRKARRRGTRALPDLMTERPINAQSSPNGDRGDPDSHAV